MIMNNPDGANLEITALVATSEIKWNKDIVLAWATIKAEQYKGLIVTAENLKDSEADKSELARIRIRLEQFRKEQKAILEGPIKTFDAEVKEVQAVLTAVETPLTEQLKKYEDIRRCEQTGKISQWIAGASTTLRKSFADQIKIEEAWTNKTATKAGVMKEIEARVAVLTGLQAQEDQLNEMKRQKAEMAEMMCRLQSEAAGLTSPIAPKDIYGISNLTMTELPAAITAAVKKQQDAETAAVQRAERQKVEAEAAKVRQAEAAAAREAVRRIEAQEVAAVPVEKQYSLTMTVYGTEFECQQFLAAIDGNGFNYTMGEMKEITKEAAE